MTSAKVIGIRTMSSFEFRDIRRPESVSDINFELSALPVAGISRLLTESHMESYLDNRLTKKQSILGKSE